MCMPVLHHQSKLLNTSTKLLIYHFFIQANLNNYPLIWININKTDMIHVEEVQECKLRIIYTITGPLIRDIPLKSAGGSTLFINPPPPQEVNLSPPQLSLWFQFLRSPPGSNFDRRLPDFIFLAAHHRSTTPTPPLVFIFPRWLTLFEFCACTQAYCVENQHTFWWCHEREWSFSDMLFQQDVDQTFCEVWTMFLDKNWPFY